MIHADTEKYAREQAGLNLKELSDILGAPYRTVQDWNAGKSKPPEWVMSLILDRVLND